MTRYWVAGILLVGLAGPLFADTVEEEAKRRNVPVVQVTAERQLSVEKSKGAALEKELADLKKQLTDLQVAQGIAPTSQPVPPAARGAVAPTPRGAVTPPRSGTAAGTPPARGGTVVQTGGHTITFSDVPDANGVMHPTTQQTPKP